MRKDGIAIVPPTDSRTDAKRTADAILRVTGGRKDPGHWGEEEDRDCWITTTADGWINMPRRCAIDGETGELVIDQEGVIGLPEGFWLAEQLNWGAEWRYPEDGAHVHGMPLVGPHALETFCSLRWLCFEPSPDEDEDRNILNKEERKQCLAKLK